MIFELQNSIKIPDQCRKIPTQQCYGEATCEAVYQRHNTCKRQSKECRNSQIESNARNNSCQLNARTEDRITIIVVINVSSG